MRLWLIQHDIWMLKHDRTQRFIPSQQSRLGPRAHLDSKFLVAWQIDGLRMSFVTFVSSHWQGIHDIETETGVSVLDCIVQEMLRFVEDSLIDLAYYFNLSR
jgi:hypothetical protein